MTSAFGRFGLLLAAFAFVGVFGTILPAEFPEVRIVAQIAYGVPLAGWALVRLGRTRTALDLPIVIALLLFLVTALLSRDVQGSLEMLAGALACALLFWLMTDLRSPVARASIAMGVVGALTAWLVIFAIRWGSEKVSWVANGGGTPNLFESTQTLFWLTTNVVPVLTLLGIGFLGYLPRGPASRILVALFIAASAVTVPMSGGRAAWLGLFVAGLALVVFRRAERRAFALGFRAKVVGGLAVTAALIAVVVMGDSLIAAAGLGTRLSLWGEALAIMAADPLTGGGPGTYSWLRLEHIQQYHAPLPSVLAHNVVLQTLSDGGVLLFVALAATVAGVVGATWRSRFGMLERDRRVAAVLIGFVLVSVLDDHSSLPAVTAMVVTMGAWLVVPSASDPNVTRASSVPPQPRSSGWQRAGLLALVAAVAAISLPAVWRVDVARAEASAGRLAMVRGDFDTAGSAFTRAIEAYPARPNYHLSAGMAFALDGRLEAARAAYRRASELAPADARAWGARAILAADETERLRFAETAAAAPSRDPRYAFMLGALLAARDDARAAEAYAHAVVRAPVLVLRIGESRDSRLSRSVMDHLLRTLDELSAEARTQASLVRADLALAEMVEMVDLPPAWRAIRALQLDDPAAAESALAEAIAKDPFSAQTWAAVRAVAYQRCDEEAARAAVTLAALEPGGGPRTSSGLVQRSTDVVYRETGLGSYQPEAALYGALPPWPDAFLPERERCPG